MMDYDTELTPDEMLALRARQALRNEGKHSSPQSSALADVDTLLRALDKANDEIKRLGDRQALLDDLDEAEAEIVRLSLDSYEAQIELSMLFPECTQDGTLHHAVLVVKGEVARLKGQAPLSDDDKNRATYWRDEAERFRWEAYENASRAGKLLREVEQLKAEKPVAWSEGFRAGWIEHVENVPGHSNVRWWAGKTPNPYRKEGS